jgi:hypothetical protein
MSALPEPDTLRLLGQWVSFGLHDGSNPGKPRLGGKEKDARYFGVVISLIEVASLTKVSRPTPEMYSVAMKMFFPSATAAE